jgi:hypothetical protein
MPFGPTHTIIKALARAAVSAFFADIQVVNDDFVPVDGPLIVCW